MTTVKVKFDSEIRRFTIDDPNPTFLQFSELLKKIFPELNLSFIRITYLDEENDTISINSTEGLLEAIKLAKSMRPPILRITLVQTLSENSNSNVNVSENVSVTAPANVNTEISNWAKKQLDYERSLKSENPQHVIKISGVPFNQPQNNIQQSNVDNNNQTAELVTSVNNPQRKKTIKDTVEEFSENQTKITNQWSEDITQITNKYSNQILEGTTPLSQSISDSCLNSALNLSEQLSTYSIMDIPINTNEELSDNISSKVSQYSTDMYRYVDEFSSGINQKTSPIIDDISSKSIHWAEESILKVSERTEQVFNQMEDIRSRMKTNVDINYQVVLDNNNAFEIESKVDSLSSKTSVSLTNIADNIAKDIMSI